MAQIGFLNLRICDMMTQMNVVIKMLLDENAALKKGWCSILVGGYVEIVCGGVGGSEV
jgi:hypothetical protein